MAQPLSVVPPPPDEATQPAARRAPTAPTTQPARRRVDGVKVGDVVGRHVLTAELGRGGMGTVFAARDRDLDRKVAIKFVAVADTAMTERFLTEARTTARCTHPNIVGVHEIGRHGDTPYLVLEHLAGVSLARLAGDQRLPLARTLAIMTAVARALACAHSHGIVHRDLTPGNIMVLDDDTVKVLDFGIAAYAQGSDGGDGERSTWRRAGGNTGTLPYAAPEQILGGRIDGRADLWSFGILLHELLVGARPFEGADEEALRAAIIDPDHPAPSLATLRPDLPTALVELVSRCLEKSRARRYRSAGELVAALQTLEAPPSRPPAPPRWRRTMMALAASAVVAATGVAVWSERDAVQGTPATTRSAPALQLERLESAMARLHDAGDLAAAATLFDGFVTQPENLAVAAEAWMRRGARELAARDLDAALASAGAAYLVAADGDEADRALASVVQVHLARRGWPEVAQALATIGATSDPALARAATTLAIATRRPLLPDESLVAADAAAVGLLSGQPEPGAPLAASAIDLDGDGRDEIAAVDGGVLRAWRPGGATLWQQPWPHGVESLCAARDAGGAWLAVTAGDVTRLFRVDDRAAELVLETDSGNGCALGDLDGDGAVELYVKRGAEVVRARAEPGGDWSVTRKALGSVIYAIVAADLDGDGRDELALAMGEWRAYDVRVLGGADLDMVDRVRLGRVSKLVAVRRGAGQSTMLLARKDAIWPSAVYLPPDRPSGSPDGYYALGLTSGRLSVASYLADAPRVFDGDLHAADLDGDGRDEALDTDRGTNAVGTIVVHLDAAGTLTATAIDGVAVLAAGRFGDDRRAAVLTRLRVGPRTETWWLGHGATPVPPILTAAAPVMAPPPDGLDAAQARTWRRASDLGRAGATASAVAAFEQLAAIVPPELQPRALLEALALRRHRGEPLGKLDESLATRAVPGSPAHLAALLGSVTAAVDEGDLPAAVRLIDEALASPALGETERARLLSTRAQVAPQRHDLFHGDALDDRWEILDPVGVRRDPVTRALMLDGFGTRTLASVELTRGQGPIELAIEGTVTRAEWAAELVLILRPLDVAAPPLHMSLRTSGGGGIYQLVIGPAGAGETRALTHELAPHDIAARVPVQARVTWLPDTDRLVRDELLGGKHRRRAVTVGGTARNAATRWRLELASNDLSSDRRPTRIALSLARLTVAGLDPVAATATTPLGAARRSLANGALDDVPALLASASGPEATLVAAVHALRAGDESAAALALARLQGDDATERLAHLVRVEDGVYAAAVGQAAGDRRAAVIALAWTAAARQHPQAELVQRELTQNLRDLDLRAPSADAAHLLLLRARANAAIGELNAAAADLDALLAPTRLAALPDGERPSVHLERARLAMRAGDVAQARRSLQAALAVSPWPEATADVVTLDPTLAAIARAPELEQVQALARPLASSVQDPQRRVEGGREADP